MCELTPEEKRLLDAYHDLKKTTGSMEVIIIPSSKMGIIQHPNKTQEVKIREITT
jgi:hypothetical protein